MNITGTTEKNPKILLMSPELEETQNIMPMSADDRDRLKKDIKNNGMRHPIICYNKDGKYFVLAGWNRREIAIELNILLVNIQTMEGEPAEFKTFVITENLSRRHLTLDQKRELIKHLLKQDPSQSNKSIAKKTGTSKETVKNHREKLETGGEIRPVTETKGSDGKTYKKPEKKPDIKPVKTPAAADPKKEISTGKITKNIINRIKQELSVLDQDEAEYVLNDLLPPALNKLKVKMFDK